MARIIDPTDDLGGEQFDRSGLVCPKCGINAITILEYPKNASSWWGRYGKARCDLCNILFPIRVELDEEPAAGGSDSAY